MSGISTEPTIRVLHVDDNAIQLRLAKQMLEMTTQNFRVTSVDSPSEALHVFKERAFDCVVTDYVMPGMNGIELARRIRAQENSPVIIIYTAQGSEEVASEAFAAGVDDYVRKEVEPAHYEVLARRIRHAVERRRAEEQYRLISERWRMFADAATDSLILYDQGLRLIEANDAALKSWGKTREEATGKHITELHPSLIGTDRLETYHKVLATGEPHVFEDVPVNSVNGVRRKTIKAFRVGDYLGLLSFDNTERLAAEERIKASEANYRAVTERLITYLDSATDAISLFDKDLRLSEANKVALANWGLTREEAVGKHFSEIHRDATLSGRIEVYKKVLLTGIPARMDSAPISNAIGDRRKIIQAFRVGEGLGVISTDITDLYNAEERLRRLNRLYRLLSDSNKAIIRVRRRGELLDEVSRAMVEVGGFRTAWFGFPNDAGELEPASVYGHRSESIRRRSMSLDSAQISDHPAVVALRENRVVVMNRLQEAPIAEWLRGIMLSGGWNSVAAVPLRRGGEAFGVLVVDSSEADSFGSDEAGLLEELGENLSVALNELIRE